ncbi:G-type lectin S-receptor-like serine/threonine-protein kinase B120 [Dioscorea cayenensis subsp. rotundata]|uniref:Receptor-like serine/threonine-protein kinase n=1 Tax=Dioscorea cayennensis subsp. rotundata TaxID=55577 RepID=A0AB40B9S2_DIOCR|nr:G-type lectin S-receptor-like serine/threonine-protein kinase B120 [Dioscorea cayenensis subsp. rotundata]
MQRMSCSFFSFSTLTIIINFILFISSSHATTNPTISISPGQPLKDGQTLISSDEVFELGFFSPGNSTNRYVGIWYFNFSTDTVLWVANRETPVTDRSGLLSISGDGNLVILAGENNTSTSTRTPLWSSNVSLSSNISTATLLGTGNFILNNSGSTVWQSFDHPTDTYLPGMKVGLNLRTNENQLFTSWKSENDPAPGNFSLGMDPTRSTQIFMWEGTKKRWRSGRWNGQVFIGIQNMVPTYIYGFKLSNFEQEQKMYFYYSQFNSSHRYVLTWEGIEKHLIWKNDTQLWEIFWAQPVTECEHYNRCGKFAQCTDDGIENSLPNCACLKGYEPVNEEEWNGGNWSSGCAKRTLFQCEMKNQTEADGFWKMEGVKLPDLSDWYQNVVSESSCQQACLQNCSCRGYAYVSGINCLIWGTDLLDIHMFSSGGEDFYLRLAASELEDNSSSKKLSTFVVVIIVLAAIFLVGCTFLLWRYRTKIKGFIKLKSDRTSPVDQSRNREAAANFAITTETGHKGNDGKYDELSMMSFDCIAASTSNFSYLNLLGEGGFGPVYKGTLPGGQEIAVKRLSRSSGQGLEEFKNEIILIAKLQHRNLVRLLGCCIEGEEKLLVYEYMPNRSLDAFIFDSAKKVLLDWKKRFEIIEGIARGLLYLHRDSRLRIIHRDLKASNILLDEEMKPKISDFGLARIFGNDDNETNTKRVAGTYGYMSPEYAMNGLFSVKSDVYSFGVLLLEIVSGKRNSKYYNSELSMNLLPYAWKLWNEDNVLEFVEPEIKMSCSRREVFRCVSVGLLCVQDRAHDRPTMSSVVLMLESGTSNHPLPKQPTFAVDTSETDSSSFDLRVNYGSGSSITMLTGR